MKFLFVNAIKNDDWGGMENWMLKLGKELPALSDDCLIVGRPSSRWPSICETNHLPFAPCTFGGDLTPWVVPRLRSICRQFQPDIAIVKGFRQARFIRRAWPSALIAVKLPFSHELTSGLIDRITFQHCVDMVLTDNHEAGSAFMKCPWVLPGKIAVIHNGVYTPDLSTLPATGKTLREFLNLPSSALIIGASGRFTSVKAFSDAIHAFAGIHRPDAHFVIFGNGPEESALKALCAQLGVSNNVHFPGWIDNARHLIWGCNIFIHPSLSEGLPNVVLEAMAGGVPVIASNAGGTSEIFTGPFASNLFKPHDIEKMSSLLRQFIETPSVGMEIGKKAREHVISNFSVNAMTTGIRKVLAAKLNHRKTLLTNPEAVSNGFQWISALNLGVGAEALSWPTFPQAKLISRSSKATVHNIEVSGRSFFTKQFTGDRWCLRRLGLRLPLALTNFLAAHKLALRGARAVPHVAAGWTASLKGRSTSLLVTESIPGLITADQWVITHPATAKTRVRFVRDLASWLAHLHGAGVASHDLKFSNILVSEESEGFKFTLLDLDNCRIRFLAVTAYDAQRNLHQLFRSFQKEMTPRDALRFMAVYRQRRRLTRSQARHLFNATEKRLQRHGQGYHHLQHRHP
jgi:glycosyltransferase involved in cell wall biosynthesis